MIIGGTAATGSSKKARKTYLRVVQNVQLTGSVPKIVRRESPVIGFSEEDARRLHHPHDDALIVSVRVGDYNVHRMLVDNGSSADILYLAFQQMGINRAQLIPTNAPLVGFGGTTPGRIYHTLRDGRLLSATNHEGCNFPYGRLFAHL